MLTKLDAFASKEEVFEAMRGLERKGPTYIKEGQHISKEQFLETFGFRDCLFDLGIDEEEQQLDIDLAYVGFLDLAYALEIDPKDISLGNRLTISYKMMVGSATKKVAAQYDVTTETIEIGRVCGAGTLAHEWAHSLDSSIAKFLEFPENTGAVQEIEIGRHGKILKRNAPPALHELVKTLKQSNRYKSEEFAIKLDNALCSTDIKPINEWLNHMEDLFDAENIGHLNRRIFRYNVVFLWAELHRKLDFYKPCSMSDEQNAEWEKLYRRVITNRSQIQELAYIAAHFNDEDYTPLEELDKFRQRLGYSPIFSEFKTEIVWVLTKLNALTGYETNSRYYLSSKLCDIKSGKSNLNFSQESLEGYYGRIDEMFARAFEVYVPSKLAVIGMKSEYLSDMLMTNRSYYPQGVERSLYNYKLDELFAQLKELGILHELKRDEFKKFEVQSD